MQFCYYIRDCCFSYPVNPFNVGYYFGKTGYDPNAYIHRCDFNGQGRSQTYRDTVNIDCGMFKPVVTDVGICYAFNAKDARTILTSSPFKEAFSEIYATDFDGNHKTQMGSGPGSELALSFLLDNNALFRPHSKSYSFKIGIGSQQDIFQIKRTMKTASLSKKLVYDVYPMEVIASDSLRDVPIQKRNCRFPHETEGQVEMFTEYSTSGCLFECRLNQARKVCRCSPWNMPHPPSPEVPVICDIVGNHCFHKLLQELDLVEGCNCLPDCNTIKFQVIEKETSVGDPKDLCRPEQIGRNSYVNKDKFLVSTLLEKMMLYPEYLAGPRSNKSLDFRQQNCEKMVAEDIVLVEINFGSDTFVRTVMDKRVTFSDQLGSLGI